MNPLHAGDKYQIDVGEPRANIIERRVFRRCEPRTSLLSAVEFQDGKTLGHPVAKGDFNLTTARHTRPVVDADGHRRLEPNIPSRAPEDGGPGEQLAQLVRASALHAEGRGIEPLVAHQQKKARAIATNALLGPRRPPYSRARRPCFQPPDKMHHRSKAEISTSMMAPGSTQVLKRSEYSGSDGQWWRSAPLLSPQLGMLQASQSYLIPLTRLSPATYNR